MKVTAEMVEDIARKHFPACMLNLYIRLKRDKHMKHFGRLQLTLFLKVSVVSQARIGTETLGRWGICFDHGFDESIPCPHVPGIEADIQGLGLPLEEAIVFWRRMYGSSMTDDKFAKEYKYNIRHNYGQEGQRRNYQPKK